MTLSRFGSLRVVAPPGVYTPRSDTAMLAAELGDVRGREVLELCSGSGALALTAARAGADRVVAVDRSRRAVASIRLNARLNGLRVDARRGDLLGALADGERFDLILANPPYLPVAPGQTRTDDRWDAGADGREVIDRILADAARHLRPGGRLCVVQSHLTGVDRTLELAADGGLRVTEQIEHRGALGPIADARRDYLVECGALARDEDHEVMVVITAERPERDRQATAA
ncbi:MAG: putative methyltransferase [Solirubrobacterales bacterium]|nr:putative methyltransferase [Solirubrobacterales bacterium]